jgi:hypothetical protein
MSTHSKMRAAYQRLSELSRWYTNQPEESRTLATALPLLDAYDRIRTGHSTGEFEECFGLTVFDIAPSLISAGLRVWKDGPGMMALLYGANPFLVLNSGEHRLGRWAEERLIALLSGFPTIDDDLLNDLDELLPIKTPWNGVSKGEIMAFLLNNAGRKLAAEYR